MKGRVAVALLLVALVVAGCVCRWQAAVPYRGDNNRDAARCVGVGANPVVMTDGRVECVK